MSKSISIIISKVKSIKPVFIVSAILYLLALITAAFFDGSLSIGILIITLLSLITFYVLFKSGVKVKKIYLLFLIVILIHFVAMVLIYYNNFYPFGGGAGDQTKYHQMATELSERFRHGDFSIKGFDKIYPDLYIPHFYPVLLAVLYALTIPSIIIGESLNVWLIALSILFLYLLVKEIGSSDKNAFLIGLAASIYPSYLYFGSLLLRDAMVVCFSVISLFLIIKIVKKFSWPVFIFLLLALGITLHFRFYIGASLLIALFASWPVINLDKKKKIIYGLIMLVLIGFLVQIFAGQGYYGIDSFEKFLNPKTITFLRETGYNSSSGNGSTVIVKAGFDSPIHFVENTIVSAVYIFLGPMPWHIKYSRQLFALAETIPWYFVLIFIFIGASRYYKEKKYKIILPLIIFAITTFFVLGIFSDTFGEYMRIRAPGFLALFALADFSWLTDKIAGVKLAVAGTFRKIMSNL